MILDINQPGSHEGPAPQMTREQMMNAIRDAFAAHAVDLKCEKCENDTFNEVMKIKKLSAIASPTGEEMVLPFKLFICSNCSEPISGLE